ncbi:hypothetical protein [Arcanobacterium pinnipediorum]|uniref:Lipoprotein n=1 Tax=Arcanobacterium pinnipediorum TaxID=1503041 RepID=A0ABY5AJL6_9ACTO|nr:hypothetical protein [Arcanobacterium pinnipediorum]USR79439.1 hypothetical protein NG665_00120 [Arcanobacterium pinnipediorum]
MKKFFAGLSIALVSVAGLVGCSPSIDKEALRDEVIEGALSVYPDEIRSQKNVEEFVECSVGRAWDEMSDEQIRELDEIVSKNGAAGAEDLPPEITSIVAKHAIDCQKEFPIELGQ